MNLIGGITKGIGQGFAQGIGLGIVYVVLIGLLIVLIVAILGLASFGIAAYCYKKRKRMGFLFFGLLGNFCLSIFLSIIISSKTTNNLSLFPFIALGFFILIGLFLRKKYLKIK